MRVGLFAFVDYDIIPHIAAAKWAQEATYYFTTHNTTIATLALHIYMSSISEISSDFFS